MSWVQILSFAVTCPGLHQLLLSTEIPPPLLFLLLLMFLSTHNLQAGQRRDGIRYMQPVNASKCPGSRHPFHF